MTDTIRELTLMDLLDSRENRVNHQKELLEQYPGSTLISITLNIPGPVKDRPEYRRTLETGLHRLKVMLNSEAIPYEEFRPLITGPEGYLVVNEDPMEIKKAAVAAEEADALGRLFDMDVLVINDAAVPDERGHYSLTDIRSISRDQLGAEPRKCLLCGEKAKACARSRAHSMDDLLKKINEILSDAEL
jgi:holo-ACP synthase